MNQSAGMAPDLPEDEYFTPEARALCARVKHKSELTDDETMMLALAAAQAALAKYFHPGARSAEEALNARPKQKEQTAIPLPRIANGAL
jgi:hypothetical protein